MLSETEDNIICEIGIHEDFKRNEFSKFYDKFHVTSCRSQERLNNTDRWMAKIQ